MAAASNRFRDFDVDLQEELGEPITFKLSGTVFQCKNPVPVGVMLLMVKNSLVGLDMNDEKAMAIVAAQQTGALWDLIEEDQHAALDDAVAKITDPTLLQSIVEYILTEAAARPTPGSSS